MQISGINSAQIFQSTSSNANNKSSLSFEQQSLIEETLSNYDASSMSEADAKEIVKTFSDANITPSKEFESTLSSMGFDAKEIGDLANASQEGNAQGLGARPAGGPPPPPPEEETLSINELLESLLDDEDTGTTTSTSSSSPYEDTSFTAFNTILDYTNQIVNLKDDAKSDVMNILKEYTNNEDQKSIQQNTVNSLNDILNKQENYNRISFYA